MEDTDWKNNVYISSKTNKKAKQIKPPNSPLDLPHIVLAPSRQELLICVKEWAVTTIENRYVGQANVWLSSEIPLSAAGGSRPAPQLEKWPAV